ncbi:hypothetical protein Salat_0859200 [Sesamum alatum]|uniref:Uncharacterized protein n=1 Tax=Sesamum alatum TaxID=300844 RepID=A0AAE1YJ01_9LAMI|nr:hypothetical protein Salat_0859200 [Sesamum alatum]
MNGDQPSGSSKRQVLAPIEVATGEVRTASNLIAVALPGSILAVKVASAGSKGVSGEVEVVQATGEPSKSKKRKRKSKYHSKSKSKSSSKSSKCSSKRSEHRAA